ncbi:MAG: sugar transferase [Bdellovibrionota bacterium]
MELKYSILGFLKLLHADRLLTALTIALGWGMYLTYFGRNGSSYGILEYSFCLSSILIVLIATRQSKKNQGLTYWPRVSALTRELLVIAVICGLAFFLFEEIQPQQQAFPIKNKTGSILLAALSLSFFAGMIEIGIASLLVGLGGRKHIMYDLSHSEEKVLQNECEKINPRLRPLLHSRKYSAQEESPSTRNVDLYVISRFSTSEFTANTDIIAAHLNGVPIVDFSSLAIGLLKRVPVPDTDQWGFLMDARQRTFIARCYEDAKRLCEPLIAIILLMILSPILLSLAAVVKCMSPGPVFYRQRRLGYLGKPFYVLKFRTMSTDAERSGPQWAAKNDERITSVGRYLRRFRLDELPQLVNIARGEMSFVGPRPERPEIYDRLAPMIPLFRHRLLVRPGVTGWAQVLAGYAASVEESHLKLEYDLYYIQNMSLSLDLHIIALTVVTAIVGEGKKEPLKVLPSFGSVRERHI